MELVMGRRPRDLMDPASMNPEQLTSTPTKQDLLNEEIQTLAIKTHLEAQQREDIRRDIAEGMKFVPPDVKVGEQVFYWQEDPSKIQQGRKSGKWLRVEIIAVKGPMVVIKNFTSIFQVNASKLRRPLDTVDLQEVPDSRERTVALVLWLFLWGPNRCLGAVLGQFRFECHTWSSRTRGRSPSRFENEEDWTLLVTGNARHLVKDEYKNPKVVVMSPDGFYRLH